MSKTYTFNLTLKGYYHDFSSAKKGNNSNAEADLKDSLSLLKNLTSSMSTPRIGVNDGFKTWYATRAEFPANNDDIIHLQNLPAGAVMESVSIVIKLSFNSTGTGPKFFYGPLNGTSGAILKEGYNRYVGYTEGTSTITIKQTDAIGRWIGSDGRSLCQYGLGFGGSTSSNYNAKVTSVTFTVTTNEVDDVKTTFTPNDEQYGTVDPSEYTGTSFETATINFIPHALESGKYEYSLNDIVVTSNPGGATITGSGNSKTLTVGTQDAEFTAVFIKTALKHHLERKSNFGNIIISSGTMSGSDMYYGNTYTFVATPNSGYEFLSWDYSNYTSAGTFTENGNSLNFVFDGDPIDVEIAANFRKQSSGEGSVTITANCNGNRIENIEKELIINNFVDTTSVEDQYFYIKCLNNYFTNKDDPSFTVIPPTCIVTKEEDSDIPNYLKYKISNINGSDVIVEFNFVVDPSVLTLSSNIDDFGTVSSDKTTIPYGSYAVLNAVTHPDFEEDNGLIIYKFDNFEIKNGNGKIVKSSDNYLLYSYGGNLNVVGNFFRYKLPHDITTENRFLNIAQPVENNIFECNFNSGKYVKASGSQTVSGSGTGGSSDSAVANAKANAIGSGFNFGSFSNVLSQNSTMLCGYKLDRSSVSWKYINRYSTTPYLANVSGIQSATKYIYMPGFSYNFNINKDSISKVTLKLNISKTSSSTFYLCTKNTSTSVATPIGTSWSYDPSNNKFVPKASSIALDITNLFKHSLDVEKTIYLCPGNGDNKTFTVNSAEMEISISSGSGLTEMRNAVVYISINKVLKKAIPFIMRKDSTSNGLEVVGIT